VGFGISRTDGKGHIGDLISAWRNVVEACFVLGERATQKFVNKINDIPSKIHRNLIENPSRSIKLLLENSQCPKNTTGSFFFPPPEHQLEEHGKVE